MNVQAEQDALRSLMELYKKAEECQMLCERAHMEPPEALRRFLGISVADDKRGSISPRQLVMVPEPSRPEAPPGAGADWIWINAQDAVVSSLILAFLGESDRWFAPRWVIDNVAEILPSSAEGSVYNAAKRMRDDGLIESSPAGWRLLRKDKGGLLWGRNLWAPKDVLAKQELAAHRRDAIVHILTHFATGLQLVQLLEQLGACAWVKAPVNKDLVKADVKILSEAGKIRQRGNSGKWEVIPNEEVE